MKISGIAILKERKLNLLIEFKKPARKKYDYQNQKSPGSVVGLSSGPVANFQI